MCSTIPNSLLSCPHNIPVESRRNREGKSYAVVLRPPTDLPLFSRVYIYTVVGKLLQGYRDGWPGASRF